MMHFLDQQTVRVGLAQSGHAEGKLSITVFFSCDSDRLMSVLSGGQNFLTKAKPSSTIAQCKGAGGSIRVRGNPSRCACACPPVTRPLVTSRTRRPKLLPTPSETPKQESK